MMIDKRSRCLRILASIPVLALLALSACRAETRPEVPLVVTFLGWYAEGNEVVTATQGALVTTRISVTGGVSGDYSLRVRRDTDLADDETVQETLIVHNGGPTTAELTFNPQHATGEAGTIGYHLDLIRDGVPVWIMDNNYGPRLRVTTGATPPALAVSFLGWSARGQPVTVVSRNQSTSARMMLIGGTPGVYTIRVRRDIDLLPDETVTIITFNRGSESVVKEITFAPAFATNEQRTDGYHVDVVKDNVSVWTMPEGYPPRLRVTTE